MRKCNHSIISKPRLCWAAVVAATTLGVAGYVRWLNLPPSVTIPSATLPVSHERDPLYLAYRCLVSADAIGAAASNYDSQSEMKLAAKRTLVSANADGLRATRSALRLPYENAPNKFANRTWNEFTDVDTLASLLNLDADVKAAQGDFAGAVDSDIDVVSLGAQARRAGGFSAMYAGDEIEAKASSRVWQQIDRLSERDAVNAARRLEAISRQRLSFSAALEQECREREQHLLSRLRTESTFAIESGLVRHDEYCSEDHGAQCVTAKRLLDAYRALLTQNKRRFFADYATLLDAYIARSKGTFRAEDGVVRASQNPALYGMNIRNFSEQWFDDTRVVADEALLECVLARRAYRARHADYPMALPDLVADGELQSVPNDLFARTAGTPLRFRRADSERYVLYSVGPDGIDNGGKPAGWSTSTPQGKDELGINDKGDWVAGRNIGYSGVKSKSQGPNGPPAPAALE